VDSFCFVFSSTSLLHGVVVSAWFDMMMMM